MSKILFLKGLPASGKSTFAKELVSKDPDTWVRVNKDDLRDMLHDKKWSRGREKTVEAMQIALAQEALERGQSVIVDNTHMSPRHANIWKDIAKLHGAEFELKEFDTSVDECIERDQKRGVAAGAVGKDVILRMFYETCEKPTGTDAPPAVIFDVDGTLALMRDRGPFEWEKVGNDDLNGHVWNAYRAFKSLGHTILIVSGRDSICRSETEEWLKKNEIEYDFLYMRPLGNMEKDAIVKNRIYEENIKGRYNITAVFDDRPQVVRFWRSRGLFVFDCGNGIEF